MEEDVGEEDDGGHYLNHRAAYRVNKEGGLKKESA